MKVVSIDVGIKNMAFCLLSKEKNASSKVEIWDIINVAEETPKKCIHCTKHVIAKFKKNDMFYCLKHAKAEKKYIIPTPELKPATINKQKIAQLLLLAEKYKITFDKEKTKKPELLSLIHTYINEKCFEKAAEVNASNVDLITVGRNIQKKFDAIFHSISHEITHVIIENQISPIANRMKTIQGMVAQYFIMKNSAIVIEFISSSNKLKTIAKDTTQDTTKDTTQDTTKDTTKDTTQDTDDENDGYDKSSEDNNKDDKTSYANRKKKGVAVCLYLLKDYETMTTYLKTHKKKDDLADAFLQGMWYINKHNK